MLEQILLSLKILWFFAFTAMLLCGMGYVLIHVFHTAWKYLRTRAARRKTYGPFVIFPPGIDVWRPAAPEVIIRAGVTIGADTMIRPGVTIGAGATVLPRSFVMRNIPPGVTVAGSPAEEVAFIRASPAEMIS